jgi:hypothetical protein
VQAPWRARSASAALVLAAYVLAFVQRPGEVVADTKVDLYVDPAGFLRDVASAWTGTGQLGHVFGGQYGGYLFPMAPWFAGGEAIGLPVWIVHRLWLGTLLAVAALGVVRLVAALVPERSPGVLHVGAAVLYVLNPYVAVYANRTSVALLAYAALPWLLLAVQRGLRDPRSWRWPAVFALALTCTGGGVNAATVGWVLLGPLLLAAYELSVGGVERSALRPLLVRLIPLTALANLWWVVPLVVHARFGLDFLPFTEQPGTIWQTTSVTESLRLAGFWTSYIGIGFGGDLRPFASHGPELLFHPVVVIAGLIVPGLALLGFAWTRTSRYVPFALLLALCGLLVMVAGFPEGTPLRRALTFTYNNRPARPVPAHDLQGRAAPGPRSRAPRRSGGCARVAPGALVGRGAARRRGRRSRLAADLGQGPREAARLRRAHVVASAADEVDRLPEGERAAVLPGKLFGFYDWGGTIDPILPSLARAPVVERSIVPYADLRAIDLQWAIDDLVSQERMLPGQLPPLLDLIGAGLLVTAADGDRSRSVRSGRSRRTMRSSAAWVAPCQAHRAPSAPPASNGRPPAVCGRRAAAAGRRAAGGHGRRRPAHRPRAQHGDRWRRPGRRAAGRLRRPRSRPRDDRLPTAERLGGRSLRVPRSAWTDKNRRKRP